MKKIMDNLVNLRLKILSGVLSQVHITIIFLYFDTLTLLIL
jgi:hypothetical protein